MPAEPRPLASGCGFSFWEIGGQVYRAPEGAGRDAGGLPMGARWECDLSHWRRFRRVFSWAEDAPGGGPDGDPADG